MPLYLHYAYLGIITNSKILLIEQSKFYASFRISLYYCSHKILDMRIFKTFKISQASKERLKRFGKIVMMQVLRVTRLVVTYIIISKINPHIDGAIFEITTNILDYLA